MDLPNLLSKLKTNQEEIEQFLSIEISADIVKTAIWQVHNGKSEIISIGSIEEWHDESATNIVAAIEKSMAKLPPIKIYQK